MKSKKDNKFYKKFFNEKFDFYKEIKKSNGNLLFVDRERIDAAFPNALFALSISEKKKLNAFIITDKDESSQIIKVYKHLGFKNFLKNIYDVNKFNNLYLLLSALAYTIFAILNIFLKDFSWFINKYKVKNILIGDLIYDTNIRFSHRYINPKIDEYFVKLLFKSTFRTLLLEKYFNYFNFKAVVIGTEPYSFNSGISLRISLIKKIKNFTLLRIKNSSLIISSYNHSSILDGAINIKKNNFKEFNNLKLGKNFLKNYHNKRIRGKMKNTLYSSIHTQIRNKKSKTKSNLFFQKLKLSNNKIILYASHAFSDAVHLTGANYIFNDFYNQLKETLDYVEKNETKNYWIFRPHPQSKYYGEDKIFKKIINSYNSKFIIYCPKYMTMDELLKNCDFLVTGMGTSAIEFNAEGKFSLSCGKSPYSDLGISKRVKNKKEYFQIITNLEKFQKIDDELIYISRKALYFLENFLPHKIKLNLKKIKDQTGLDFFTNIDNANFFKIWKLSYEYFKVFKKGKIYQNIMKSI